MLQPLTMKTAGDAPDLIENRTFDEIAIGDSASLSRTLSKDDIALFAVMSGDVNPAHLDERYAEASMFHRIIGTWHVGGRARLRGARHTASRPGHDLSRAGPAVSAGQSASATRSR